MNFFSDFWLLHCTRLYVIYPFESDAYCSQFKYYSSISLVSLVWTYDWQLILSPAYPTAWSNISRFPGTPKAILCPWEWRAEVTRAGTCIHGHGSIPKGFSGLQDPQDLLTHTTACLNDGEAMYWQVRLM